MEFIRNELHIQKIHTTEKLNRTRQTPDFQVGQYCFVKDNNIIIGSTRPFTSLYSHDPWVILKTLPTTAVVRRFQLYQSWVPEFIIYRILLLS